jgi:hypothetical protein
MHGLSHHLAITARRLIMLTPDGNAFGFSKLDAMFLRTVAWGYAELITLHL